MVSEQFLLPPDRDLNGRQDLEKMEKALRSVRDAFPDPTPQTRRELLREEATASSAIEREHDPDRVRRLAAGLDRFLKQPISLESILTLHRDTMRGQPHAQPGMLRTCNVTVGPHRPPGREKVPELMDGLMSFLNGTHHPLTRAVWGHVQFETIHPFADGNGRTGRAILLHPLQAPAPLSRYILGRQQEYYRLFQNGEWEDWLEWICRGIRQECGGIAGTGGGAPGQQPRPGTGPLRPGAGRALPLDPEPHAPGIRGSGHPRPEHPGIHIHPPGRAGVHVPQPDGERVQPGDHRAPHRHAGT